MAALFDTAEMFPDDERNQAFRAAIMCRKHTEHVIVAIAQTLYISTNRSHNFVGGRISWEVYMQPLLSK